MLGKHTSRITSSICGARLSTDGREPDSERGGVPNFVEERSASEIADVIGHLEGTVRAGAFCVDLVECLGRMIERHLVHVIAQ